MLSRRVGEIQEQLARHGIDGWLLYDVGGSNPIAEQALELEDVLLSRRFFYFVPAEGQPVAICHRVDASRLPPLPGLRVVYAGWRDLEEAVARLAVPREGRRPRVAMEYFPGGAIPSLSLVDAGTVEWLRELGFDVVSSSDLVQHILCRLTEAQAGAHLAAAAELDGIKNEAFAHVRRRLAAGRPLLEYELQHFIMERMAAVGLVTDYPPIVAVGANTADPHHRPSPERPARIVPDRVLLVDLLARHDRPVCAYADITWVAYTGARPPEDVRRIFDLVVRARDAGLEAVREQYDAATGVGPRGCDVDRVVRGVIEEAGYGAAFPHRTGHNLGALTGHGPGTNIDDLETHDTRPLVQGTCFTLKPGVYLRDWGVRSEIDVYLDHEGPVIGIPVQTEIVCLG